MLTVSGLAPRLAGFGERRGDREHRDGKTERVSGKFMLFSEYSQAPANNGEFALIEKYSANSGANLTR
jgi:hypothetical protein